MHRWMKKNGTFRLAATTSTKLKGEDSLKDDAGETQPISQICAKDLGNILGEDRMLPACAPIWP